MVADTVGVGRTVCVVMEVGTGVIWRLEVGTALALVLSEAVTTPIDVMGTAVTVVPATLVVVADVVNLSMLLGDSGARVEDTKTRVDNVGTPVVVPMV